MSTIEEEFRGSTDDWHGIAYAHEREAAGSFRAYLQRIAPEIPPHHVITNVQIVMCTTYAKEGRTPFLRISHFDAGEMPDPVAAFHERVATNTLDSKFTVVKCGLDLFEAFSDFEISLTARGYDIVPIDEPGAIYRSQDDIDDGPEN
ncbi:hypothetical protein [Burkholderia vietnamiensis]|uniref:hypothetical protein n=1 Tax=Burkholderia vietnamiensis TaxID=60552 RepID=UPI00158A10E1|nr:hypothetical protein [Burkholderia vietnamiensis]